MKVQRAHSLSPRSGPAAQTGLQFLLHQVYSILLGQERRGIKSPSLKPTQMGLDTLAHYSCPAPSTAYLRRAINIRQSSQSSRNQRRINLEEKRGKITAILLSLWLHWKLERELGREPRLPRAHTSARLSRLLERVLGPSSLAWRSCITPLLGSCTRTGWLHV